MFLRSWHQLLCKDKKQDAAEDAHKSINRQGKSACKHTRVTEKYSLHKEKKKWDVFENERRIDVMLWSLNKQRGFWDPVWAWELKTVSASCILYEYKEEGQFKWL